MKMTTPKNPDDALAFCEMVLEIGMPDDTVIPVWPIETEMAITHPLTVGMVKQFKASLSPPISGDAQAAFKIICDRLPGYQNAKDIVRAALTPAPIDSGARNTIASLVAEYEEFDFFKHGDSMEKYIKSTAFLEAIAGRFYHAVKRELGSE
jgi:hypothetical protein